MGKEQTNNPAMEVTTEPLTEQKDKFLQNIPTRDDEILKKLDDVTKKLESFEILEEESEEKEEVNKKDLSLAVAFVALIVVAAGFFVLKKEVKNSNE